MYKPDPKYLTMPGSSITGIGNGSVPRCTNCRRIGMEVELFKEYFEALAPYLMLRLGSTLTGAIDGVNRNFMLSEPGNELFLFKNGLMQNAGVDYILSDDKMAITFMSGNIPQLNDILVARVSVRLFDYLNLSLNP